MMIKAILFIVACVALQACSSDSTSLPSDDENNGVLDQTQADNDVTPTQVDPTDTSIDTQSKDTLLDRSWNLTSFTRLDGREASLVETTSFEFKADSNTDRFRARLHCNEGGGSYRLGDGVIVFKLGIFTEADCGLSADGAIEQQRSFEDLMGGQGEDNLESRELMIELENSSLVLTAPDGRKLVFSEVQPQTVGTNDPQSTSTDPLEPESLLGRVWEIENYTDESGQVVSVAEETKYQFLFESQTTDLQAFIGCVNFGNSVYELNDSFLIIRLGDSDAVACNTDTEEFASQSISIGNLIRGGDSGESVPFMFTVSNDQLILEAADGRRLELVEVDELLQQQ